MSTSILPVGILSVTCYTTTYHIICPDINGMLQRYASLTTAGSLMWKVVAPWVRYQKVLLYEGQSIVKDEWKIRTQTTTYRLLTGVVVIPFPFSSLYSRRLRQVGRTSLHSLSADLRFPASTG